MNDYEIQSIASSELHAGEQLIWWGQPSPGAFAKHGIPFMLFGIPWTLITLFWMGMALSIIEEGIRYFLALFGLPFVLVGFWLLASPLIKSRKALQTVYVITTRRVMIISAGRNRHVLSYWPADLARIETIEKKDGSGNLLFMMNEDRKHFLKTGFYGIPQVKRVEMILRDHLVRPEKPLQG